MKTICVCIDGSDGSKRAVEFASRLSPENIVLLHVRTPPFGYGVHPGAMYADLAAFEAIDNENKKRSFKLLRETAASLKKAGFNVQAFALRGSPETELQYKITKIEPSLVVLGSRGMGPISRVLIGSVSDYLVHHLNVPVLIFPPLNLQKE